MKSILLLDLYIYEEFYGRFSNNEFSMEKSSLLDYETHFTVMNYKSGV